ncbi:GH25 family lysozyme [Parafrankia sp. FMc6]|uniref:GH25 family lysozyme n=1 Tax=Parafrankia soli TaxID=2599596 RepID=UPI0034D73954
MSDFADIASPYQDGADLAVYAAAGHDRIVIKASEGTGYRNPRFATWWAAAGRAGLARGAYHYARPSRSAGAAEADYFVSVIQAAGGLGPRDWVWLDTEDPDERGPKAADHAAAFATRMVQLGYTGGVIYSYAPYLAGIGLTAAMLPERWRWLHVAHYNAAVADERVPLPLGWVRDQVLGRQYTDKAAQAGIPGASDRNRVLREWLPSAARAIEEDDVRPSEWTPEDRRAVGQAVLDLLWAQMGDVGPTIKQGDVGDVVGQTYNKAGDLQSKVGALGEDTAAIRSALALILGPDHPATAALSSAPQAAHGRRPRRAGVVGDPH